MTLKETIEEMNSVWYKPLEAKHRGIQIPFKLVCTFSDQGVDQYVLNSLDIPIPDSLGEFWLYSESARLFEDSTYAQWGLEILNPLQAIKETTFQKNERPEEFKDGDLIIGKFLGDMDLLGIRCNQNSGDFGKVFVALPIDPRSNWYFISHGFSDFLEKYLLFMGDKFWEIE